MNYAVPRTFDTCTMADLLALLPAVTTSQFSEQWLAQSIGDLHIDSRHINEGDVFVAIKTPFADGAAYVETALKQGAIGCLVDAELLTDTTPDLQNVIAVDGLSAQLAQLAVKYYLNPSSQLPVIGITGTNGKSSCVHFLAQMANTVWGTPGGMIGTLGWGLLSDVHDGTHTTPDTVSLQRMLAKLYAQQASLAAIEVSSHALTQSRPAGIGFAIAAFTNLSQDHLDYHADMAAYLQAKQRLFNDYSYAVAVIGIDDQYGAELATTVRQTLPASSQLLTTSCADEQADVCVQLLASSKQQGHGLLVSISTPWGNATVQTHLLGGFNAANLATCVACLGGLKVPFEQIVAAVEALQPVPGRMQCVSWQPLVIVDYAHTPDALDNALRSCRQHTQANLWCVFGCGGDRDRGKRPQMGRIAEQLADRLVITSDNPRNEDPQAIMSDIRQGLQQPDEAQLQTEREQAIRQAITQASDGDCILIAGKGHEQSQHVGDCKRPFDDVGVAKEILEQLAC